MASIIAQPLGGWVGVTMILTKIKQLLKAKFLLKLHKSYFKKKLSPLTFKALLGLRSSNLINLLQFYIFVSTVSFFVTPDSLWPLNSGCLPVGGGLCLPAIKAKLK